jgi:hypothetical protein
MVMKDGDAQAVAAGIPFSEPAPSPVPVWPMHSPWWIVPFAACLGVEWWLRRRSGLR